LALVIPAVVRHTYRIAVASRAQDPLQRPLGVVDLQGQRCIRQLAERAPGRRPAADSGQNSGQNTCALA
jgi:hypothetical protein